jgi:hypothetical protein
MNGRQRGEALRDEIYKAYEAKQEMRRPNRLRPSELGRACERSLWYRFRWADELKPFSGRMLRLFETGHSQEDRMVNDLRRVGGEVYARDPSNPIEQISISTFGGHSKGFLDGVATNLPFAIREGSWALVECKTHSIKSFKSILNDGVQAAKPEHYAQMQLYIDEHNLDEGLYIAVAKDTDEIHCEFIDRDHEYVRRLRDKGDKIVYRPDAPGKINKNPEFFSCKFCDAWKVCHGGERPERNCRTCNASVPVRSEDGKNVWACKLHNKELTLDEQRAGCMDHRYLRDMVPGVPGYPNNDGNIDYVDAKTGEVWTDRGPAHERAAPPAAADGPG